MPRVCTICRHKKLDEIDRALIEGKPYRYIATHYDISTGALQRHKAEHLPVKLALAKRAKDVTAGGTLLDQIQELVQKAWEILYAAENAGQLSVALQGVREARGCIELFQRMIVYQTEAAQQQAQAQQREDQKTIWPFVTDPVFMEALQRAIDETEERYIKAGKLQPTEH